MKMSKHQRERHKGAAYGLIQRIEGRLQPVQGHRYGANEGERIAKKIDLCKERLSRNPKDKDLLSINMELADLFYLTSNAVRRVQRAKPHSRVLN